MSYFSTKKYDLNKQVKANFWIFFFTFFLQQASDKNEEWTFN